MLKNAAWNSYVTGYFLYTTKACMLVVVSIFMLSQPLTAQKSSETIQEYYTQTRTTFDKREGLVLQLDSACGLNLSANPRPDYCADRCISKAFLRISFGCTGLNRRFVSPDSNWSASLLASIIVRDEGNYLIGDLCDTISLTLSSDSIVSKPVAVYQRDVTNYLELACEEGLEDGFDSVLVTVLGLDSSGVPHVDDSLWLEVEVIEVESIGGRKGSSSLADCSVSSNIMIEPYDVSAVNPTTLFWETVDCPNPLCQQKVGHNS